MAKRSNGFSMLELMIVLAIMAVLAMAVVPNYRLYIEKAKFSEVMQAVAPYKAAVEVCAHALGSLGGATGNCGTPGLNGLPKDYLGNPTRGYIGRIKTSYHAPDVYIKAESQRLVQNYNYILKGHIDSQGELEWQVDADSTCLTAGLCHSMT